MGLIGSGRFRNPDRIRRLFAACLVVAVAGCEVDLSAPRPSAPEIPDVPDDPGGVVFISFSNLSPTEAVDVQFHATNDPLTVLPDDLFVEATAASAGIGVAGTGIIQPLDDDLIIFPCTANLSMGTAGAIFLDNDSGETRGVAAMRWLQDRPLNLCGRLVAFEFAGTEGNFTVSVSVLDRP